MNWKNNIGILVAGSIAALLAVGAIALLIVSQSKYSTITDSLSQQVSQYVNLIRRDPFPSSENVAMARKNLDDLNRYARDLRISLQQGQIQPVPMERADFPPLVERTLNRIWEAASENNVTYPEKFAFGFQRYIDGDLPIPPNIPRLVVQLKTVEALCNLMFASKISSLQDITRDEFDKAGVAVEEEEEIVDPRAKRRQARNVPAAQKTATVEVRQRKTDLYEIEPFTLNFRARENAVWELLNEFAKSKLFVVVTYLEFSSPVSKLDKMDYKAFQIQKVRDQTGGKVTPSQAARIKAMEAGDYTPPTAEERVAAGREEVDVILKCDVYRFRVDEMEGVQ